MGLQHLNHPSSFAKYLVLFLWMITHAQASENDSRNYPCWLSNLAFNGNKNIYGVAQPFTASLLPTLHFAKLNAINNWAISESLEKVSVKQNLAPLTSFQLHQTTLYFVDEFSNRTGVYSLVSDVKPKSKPTHSCSLTPCKIETCSPKWLCENESEQMAIFGISAKTAHPNDQILHTIQNAQELARTAKHSLIQGLIALLNIDTSHYHQSNLQQEFKITELTSQSDTVKVDNLCHYKGNLVSQILFPYSQIGRDHDWLTTPNFANYSGVVGHAKGYAASGRLSDLVQIAARRGLFELAKAKQITVDSDLELEVNSNGYYSLVRKSEQTTESIISAFVADIKMELNDNFQPEVFIWLLENKG